MPKDTNANKEMENAISNPKKASGIVKILEVLAGDEFKTIVNAVTGSSDEKLNQVIAQVKSNQKKMADAEDIVRQREATLREIDKELDQLRQENTKLDKQINRIRSKITVHTQQDADELSGKDLLD